MIEKLFTIKHPNGKCSYAAPYMFEDLTINEIKKYVFKFLINNLWIHPDNEETARKLDEYLHDYTEEMRNTVGKTKKSKAAVKRAEKILAAWESIYAER